MSDCKQCPYSMGDSFERDCGFPDCMGGWEEAYKDLQQQLSALQADNERLRGACLHVLQDDVNERIRAEKTIAILQGWLDEELSDEELKKSQAAIDEIINPKDDYIALQESIKALAEDFKAAQKFTNKNGDEAAYIAGEILGRCADELLALLSDHR